MTNYNERLEIILRHIYLCGENDGLGGELTKGIDATILEDKKDLTSLIKELVAEAKPNNWGNVIAEPEHSENLKAYNAAYHDGVVDAVKNFEQNLLKALEEK